MIKTIATFTQTTPFPQPQLDNIMNQCNAWQAEGKYTGELDATHNLVTGVKCITRQGWVDYAAAQAYQSFSSSMLIDTYPDFNIDIVVE